MHTKESFTELAQNFAYEVKGDMGLPQEDYQEIIDAYIAGFLKGELLQRYAQLEAEYKAKLDATKERK